MGDHRALVGGVHRRRRRARRAARSIFAVGDEKQSIFSFQGADTARVRREAHPVQARLRRRRSIEWRDVQPRTIRSARATIVLAAVDARVRAAEALSRLTADRVRDSAHQALPDAAPGLVEIWPLVEAARSADPKPGMRHSTRLGNEPAGRSSRARSRTVRALDRRNATLSAPATERQAVRAGRHPGAGAPARAAVRGDHPRAQERRRRGRRRRPAGAHRAHRGDGPDGARRRAAAAGGRSRARDRAQKSRCSGSTTRTCSRSRRSARASLRAALARSAGRDAHSPDACDADRRAGDAARRPPFAFYARVLGAGRRAHEIPVAARTRGQRRARRIPQSRARLRAAARRRRCRASSPGCAPPRPRSSATWRSRATRCG